MNAKSRLREEARTARDGIAAALRPALQSATLERVRQLPEWESSAALLAYCAVRSELDPAALVDEAARRGLPVFLPAALPGGALEWRVFRPDSQLREGRYGIPEPTGPAVSPPAGALVLVPGLAFDRAGRRVGYGGGYYDRYLPTHEGPKVGLCFEVQLHDSLPAAAHDVRVDIVVTERRSIRAPGD